MPLSQKPQIREVVMNDGRQPMERKITQGCIVLCLKAYRCARLVKLLPCEPQIFYILCICGHRLTIGAFYYDQSL